MVSAREMIDKLLARWVYFSLVVRIQFRRITRKQAESV
jgi:hypothetical protein